MSKFCPNCGIETNDNSKFCPECGKDLSASSAATPQPKVLKNRPKTVDEPTDSEKRSWWSKQSNNKQALVLISSLCCLGLIIFVVAGGLLSPDSNTTNYTPSTDDISTDTSDSTSESATTGELKFLSSSAHRDSIGSYIIDGEIQNNYDTTASYVQIYATGYDSSGSVVTTGSSYADITSLSSGSKSPFKVYLDDPNEEIVRYELQATA